MSHLRNVRDTKGVALPKSFGSAEAMHIARAANMASFSDKATTVADFPFTDLHSFKDYVGFVKLCAPDMFSQREWAPPNEQWDLARAFDGLRYGIGQTIDKVDERHKPAVELGMQLVEEAAKLYQEGDVRGGFTTLQRLQDTLDAIPSR